MFRDTKTHIEILEDAFSQVQKSLTGYAQINTLDLLREKIDALKKQYREEYLDYYGTKIAAYIYSNTVNQTESGAYCTYSGEIEQNFELDKKIIDDPDLRDRIESKLYEYPGTCDLEVYEEKRPDGVTEVVFDLNMYTNYLPADYDFGVDD